MMKFKGELLGFLEPKTVTSLDDNKADVVVQGVNNDVLCPALSKHFWD